MRHIYFFDLSPKIIYIIYTNNLIVKFSLRTIKMNYKTMITSNACFKVSKVFFFLLNFMSNQTLLHNWVEDMQLEKQIGDTKFNLLYLVNLNVNVYHMYIN